MLLTFQGYFEQGRIIPKIQVRVPEHKEFTVTVSDEVDTTTLADTQKSNVEDEDLAERQAAFERLLKFSGTLHREVNCKKELAEYRDERYGRSY